MEVSQEKLKEISSILENIKVHRNSDGEKYFDENGANALELVGKDADIVNSNFKYFAGKMYAVMYPDEFLTLIKNLPQGNKIIAENLDFILDFFKNKKNKARIELLNMPEVSKKIAEDFENKLSEVLGTDIKKIEDDQSDDFKRIQNCYTETRGDFKMFFRLLLSAENPSDVLEANKDVILNTSFNSGMLSMVEELSQHPEYHKFLRDNIEKIVDICYVPHLAELYSKIKEVCPEEYEKEAFTIDNIYLPALKQIEDSHLYGREQTDKQMQINGTCSEIIHQGRTKDLKTLMEFMINASESKDLRVCGSGYYSITIQAGDKVVKLGGTEKDSEEKGLDKLPYHPRLLLPIIRKKDTSIDKEHPLNISVYEVVDTDIEISDEELLEVYRDLREDGIRWLDVKKENIGRLRKDNIQHEFGQNIPAPLDYLGIEDSGVPKKTLKAGELVVIDLDYLYLDGKADNFRFIPNDLPQCILDYEKEYMERKNKIENKSEDDSHDEH